MKGDTVYLIFRHDDKRSFLEIVYADEKEAMDYFEHLLDTYKDSHLKFSFVERKVQ